MIALHILKLDFFSYTAIKPSSQANSLEVCRKPAWYPLWIGWIMNLESTQHWQTHSQSPTVSQSWLFSFTQIFICICFVCLLSSLPPKCFKLSLISLCIWVYFLPLSWSDSYMFYGAFIREFYMWLLELFCVKLPKLLLPNPSTVFLAEGRISKEILSYTN